MAEDELEAIKLQLKEILGSNAYKGRGILYSGGVNSEAH